MNNNPTKMHLSIVVPTKDRPTLLLAAIQSIFAAIPSDGVEVIVVDDRSVSPVAASIQITDSRLRVLKNEATPGASGARNFGVSHAFADRILFLDDDDLMLPNYASWVQDQDADYGHSSPLKFDGLAIPDNIPVFPGGQAVNLNELGKFRKKIAGLGCGFWVNRSVFLDVGGIAEDIRVNEDTDFSIRLLKAGYKGISSPHAGVMVRNHEADGNERPHLTHAAGAVERAKYFGMILSRHGDWLATQPDATKFLLRRQLKLLTHAGEVEAATELLASKAAKPYRAGLHFYYIAEKLASAFKNKRN